MWVKSQGIIQGRPANQGGSNSNSPINPLNKKLKRNHIKLFAISSFLLVLVLGVVLYSHTNLSSGTLNPQDLRLASDDINDSVIVKPADNTSSASNLSSDSVTTDVNSSSPNAQTNQVTVNGQTTNLPSDGSYSKTVTSSNGQTNISVHSNDSSSATGSSSSSNNSNTTVNVTNVTD